MILPPYAEMLGVSVEPDADGAPVLLMPFGEHVVGRPGFLHGGAIAGLLEVAALAALRHALGDETVRIKPITVTVDYQRGGRNQTTHAAAHVTRLGTRVANVEAIAWQDDRERPIASARLNCLLQR
jgi:uncharacterized protein (TIGR00369 family)